MLLCYFVTPLFLPDLPLRILDEPSLVKPLLEVGSLQPPPDYRVVDPGLKTGLGFVPCDSDLQMELKKSAFKSNFLALCVFELFSICKNTTETFIRRQPYTGKHEMNLHLIMLTK